MWGALVLLGFFVVIHPASRDALLGMMEQARLRVAVEAPLSYFLLVVLGGSAAVSALIMRFWPRVEDNREPVRVLHRYQGRAEVDLARAPKRPSFSLQRIFEAARAALAVQARERCSKVLRSAGGFTRLKRLPGA